MSKTKARPALRYHGAKWLIGPWIISHFPSHVTYVEPFAGSASVLLQKEPSAIEAINDLDGEVVNYFTVLRDHENELIRAIQFTPFARAELDLSFESTNDPLESARRFYTRSFLNIAGPTAQWGSGMRRQKVGKPGMTTSAESFAKTEHLYQIATRLKQVYIEQEPAVKVIQRYDSSQSLFYVDPPYPSSTRGRWKDKAYSHEMTDNDHRELANCLNNIEGMALISGYECELYQELFADWVRVEREAPVNGSGSATESLWLSPSASNRLNGVIDFGLFERVQS